MPTSLALAALVTIAGVGLAAGPQQKPSASTPDPKAVVATADYEGSKVSTNQGLAWWDAADGRLKVAKGGPIGYGTDATGCFSLPIAK